MWKKVIITVVPIVAGIVLEALLNKDIKKS